MFCASGEDGRDPRSAGTGSTASRSVNGKSLEENIKIVYGAWNDGGIEKQFSSGQAAFHHSLNRFQRSVEREVHPEIPLHPLPSVEVSTSNMNSLIAAYLLHTGRLEQAVKIHPILSIEQLAPYEELHSLICSLRSREVFPILDWLSTGLEGVEQQAIFDLTFNLRKLHYGNLLSSKLSDDALEYAKVWFLPYMQHYREEMQKLLGALAFLPSIEDPNYRALVGSTVLMRAEEQLTHVFCRSRGLSIEPHLLTLIRASSHALPNLAKASILTNSMGLSQSSNGPIATPGASPSAPISFEIPLPKEFAFHSLFCCPVSKELSTSSNPPQLLPCGHVLSKDIVVDLARGRASYRPSSNHSEPIHPFKCPYCPEKVHSSQVKTLIFD